MYGVGFFFVHQENWFLKTNFDCQQERYCEIEKETLRKNKEMRTRTENMIKLAEERLNLRNEFVQRKVKKAELEMNMVCNYLKLLYMRCLIS